MALVLAILDSGEIIVSVFPKIATMEQTIATALVHVYLAGENPIVVAKRVLPIAIIMEHVIAMGHVHATMVIGDQIVAVSLKTVIIEG
jgi:hypothetical protein